MTWDEGQTEGAESRDLGRRDLVRSAAGGFVLAASGLLLPVGAGEIAAHDRSKRKRRRRRKNKGPRGGPFRSTALTIQTVSRSGTYTFEANYYTKSLWGDTYFPWGADRAANPVQDRFAENANWTPRVGVLITPIGSAGRGPSLFVDVRNEQIGFPQGAAYYGSSLDPSTDVLGTALIGEQSFLVNEIHQGTFVLVGGYARATCTLKRRSDSNDFIEFDLLVDVIG